MECRGPKPRRTKRNEEAKRDGDGTGVGGTRHGHRRCVDGYDGGRRARDSVQSVGLPSSSFTVRSSTGLDAPTVPAGDGLVTAMPDLLIASEMFKTNAFTARVARGAYRAAMNLGSKRS